MKKVFYVLTTVALVALFASCGGVEKDAKDAAKKTCDCFKYMQNQDEEKYKACEKDMEELGKKLEAKYTEKKDQDAFQQVFQEEFKNCDVKLDLGL